MRLRRITIVTSGHLSTCPRMLKAADAFAAASYQVRVVATRHEPWAIETDRDVRSRRPWQVEIVNYRRGDSGLTYWWTGGRHKAARAAAAALGPERAPFPVVARAFGRVHSELVRAITARPADLIYGGTTGALAPIAEAARRMGVPYGIDLEDLHSGESAGPEATFTNALAARVERSVLERAAFATTSSEAIAEAYFAEYGLSPTVVHNTFSLPPQRPNFLRIDPGRLRIYWFSQTIGPGRGLEEAVLAAGRCDINAVLALRGRALPGYIEQLQALAQAKAPKVPLIHLPPAPPDTMIDLARDHDIGLALEQMAPLNRQLCLPNKPFTYLLAGLAVAMTDTPGQRALGVDLGRGAALIPPGDVDALSAALAGWAHEPAALDCARQAAWQGAVRRWHWEHEEERGRLFQLASRLA